MSECFEISFIYSGKKTIAEVDIQFENFLGFQFRMPQKTDSSFQIPFLRNKKVLLERFCFEHQSYIEYIISISNNKFTKNNFNEQKQNFYNFIDFLMKKININYVVASYELNSFLLDNISNITDFSDAVLEQFPFSFQIKNSELRMNYNSNAQNIFEPLNLSAEE